METQERERLEGMYSKMDELAEEMRQFLDENEDENGGLSEENAKAYEKLQKRLLAIKAQIERYKVIVEAKAETTAPTSKPVWSQQHWGGNSMDKGTSVAGAEYRQNFIAAFRKGFRGAKNNFLRESEKDMGGYLLPTEFDSQIISALSEENILRKLGKTITTASEHKITVVANKPSAEWISEGEEIQLSSEKFGQVSLNAYKLAIGVVVTNELLADSYFDLETHLIDEFSRAIALAEENAMLNGNSDKSPKGLLPTLETSATAFIKTNGAEISADDLLSLQYSLRRPYRKSACWLMSDATLAQIRKLKDNTGNFVWQPSLTEDEPPRLFGQPVFSSEFMPAPTTGNCAVLYGDFKNYFVIGERGSRTIKPLHEILALSDRTAFLMIERIDSALTNSEAIRGLKIRA